MNYKVLTHQTTDQEAEELACQQESDDNKQLAAAKVLYHSPRHLRQSKS